jgi:F-type H+-transporting ATPase subunit alpha
LSVEKQVLSLFVATSGGVDSIPVADIGRFEQEFLQFVETGHPGILKSIGEKKALDDSIKGEIKKALDAFKERFAPTAK